MNAVSLSIYLVSELQFNVACTTLEKIYKHACGFACIVTGTQYDPRCNWWFLGVTHLVKLKIREHCSFDYIYLLDLLIELENVKNHFAVAAVFELSQFKHDSSPPTHLLPAPISPIWTFFIQSITYFVFICWMFRLQFKCNSQVWNFQKHLSITWIYWILSNYVPVSLSLCWPSSVEALLHEMWLMQPGHWILNVREPGNYIIIAYFDFVSYHLVSAQARPLDAEMLAVTYHFRIWHPSPI